MADDWPAVELSIKEEPTEIEIKCKGIKELKEEKLEQEEIDSGCDEWRRPSDETPSEDCTLATNETSSGISSDVERERSSASSVISERLDDQTFEGEEVCESEQEDDESYWTEVMAAEAERALQRSHIPHPTFFVDSSNRYGPNVTLLSSTTSGANEEFAIKTAAKTLQRIPSDKMLSARIIKQECEEKFGTQWHCILSDGNLGTCSRSDEHLSFMFRQYTVYLFRHQCYEPDDVHIRRLKNPDTTLMAIEIPNHINVIANGMNSEKQQYAIRVALNAIDTCESTDNSVNNGHIAERIVEAFEEVYGAHYHCAVSDSKLGYHVRYDPENIILFEINNRQICLFKQNSTDEDPFMAVHPLRERKSSGMLIPLDKPKRQYVIKNGMNSDMLHNAIDIAQKAISENKSVEKIAHQIRVEFESQYSPPYHCIVSNDHFGFYAHYDIRCFARFVVDDHYVLLFRSQEIPHKDLRVTRYIPIGCAAPDIRVVSSGMTRSKERFAIDLASEGIQRYVGDKMRASRHVVERFEERHGTPYHCAMSDGELGFSVHHRAAMHFKIGSTAVLLFRNI